VELRSFASDVYSLSGEDGILAEIIKRLGLDASEGPLWCVEFGAWDGVYLSNTFNLVRNSDWRAVYIEGDRSKFADLVRLAHKYPSIEPICAFVSSQPESINSLDQLLHGRGVPLDFDLLSIDIDSDDLDVWESVHVFTPKVVVIEVDSSLGPDIVTRFSESGSANSFAAALELGRAKGYTPVCHTGNVIFVRSDLVGLVLAAQQSGSTSTVAFDERWMTAPSLMSKGRAWLRYRAYLVRKRAGYLA
jgi:hypothetical protein